MLKKTIILGFVVLGIILIFILNQKLNQKEKITEEMVYKTAFRVQIKTLDPAQTGDLYSHVVVAQIYEPLFQYSYLKRPYQLEPLLAEEMPKISPDKLTYIIKIKKNVFFQDDKCFHGKKRELTAEDFIYSFKRIADIKNRSTGWWIFDGMIEGLNEFREYTKKVEKVDYSKEVSGLKLIDRYTLQIKLTRAYPQLLYILAMSYTASIPKEAVEEYKEEIMNHPVGTGPYKLLQWVRGSKIILVKNPNFRKEFYPKEGTLQDKKQGLLLDAGKQIPFIDRIEISFIAEDQPYWLHFLKGNLDVAGIPKDSFQQAISSKMELRPEMKTKGIILEKTEEPDVTYIGFNMEDPIVGKNKYLRQAMNLAYNTQKIIELFYNNRAILAYSPLPPNIPGYDPNLRNPYREYNIEKAKYLLAKAGYPEGRGLPILIYENSGADTTSRQMAEFFIKEMEKIGIKIKVHYNTWPQFLEKIKTKSAQIFGLAWLADYPDAENFLQLFYGPNSSPGPNNCNFNHPEYNKLYEKIRFMEDSPVRRKIISQMINIIIEECPWILGAHRISYGLKYKWVENAKPHVFASNTIKYLKINLPLRKKMLSNE